VRSASSSLFRNPISGLRGRAGGIVKRVTDQATGAGVGALGGIGLDFLLRFAPLKFKTGPLAHVTRAAVAVGLGTFLGNKHRLIGAAANGMLTITMYNALRQYVAGPLNLGEISDADMQELSDAYSLGVYDAPPSIGVNTPALGVYDNQMSDAYDMAQ
ncbi:MAG: hypothetical protein RL268_513, partial [Pseudomonadota bacterium]